MEMLLAAGVPVDVKAGDEHWYRTPLVSAIGDFEAFSFLLERGAKLEAAGKPGLLLDSAASRRSPDVARYLLEAGAPVEGDPGKLEYGYTALWSAISGSSDRGRYEMVKLLLEHGAAPEREMYGGQTLLDLAREQGQERVVALMERSVRGEPLDMPVEASPVR
jgi:ankyrin repeat protein